MDTTASNITVYLQILTGIVSLLTVLIGVGVVHLRLFTANAINEAKEEIVKEFRQEFARKEMVDLQLREYDRRIQRLETQNAVQQTVTGTGTT